MFTDLLMVGEKASVSIKSTVIIIMIYFSRETIAFERGLITFLERWRLFSFTSPFLCVRFRTAGMKNNAVAQATRTPRPVKNPNSLMGIRLDVKNEKKPTIVVSAASRTGKLMWEIVFDISWSS